MTGKDKIRTIFFAYIVWPEETGVYDPFDFCLVNETKDEEDYRYFLQRKWLNEFGRLLAGGQKPLSYKEKAVWFFEKIGEVIPTEEELRSVGFGELIDRR